MAKRKLNIIKIAFVLWALCIVLFLISIGIATQWFSTMVDNTNYGSSQAFLTSTIALISLGVLFFAIGTLSYSFKKFKLNKTKNKKGNWLWTFFKFLLFLSIMPAVLIFNIIKPLQLLKNLKKELKKKTPFFTLLKKILKKILLLIFPLVILLPIWISGYALAIELTKTKLGYTTTPNGVSGTGSMYPTFPKGQGKTITEQSKEIVATPGMFPYPNGLVLFGKRYFNHEIGKGDIITFENEQTKKITQEKLGKAYGYIKRVIATEGDKIEIKGGIIYLNGEPQKESYVAKARSTFAGPFLSECTTLTVPQNKLFVMGDNRKGSGDSRHELGLVDIQDVTEVIPWDDQLENLSSNWHDPIDDLKDSAKIKINKEKYLEILNQEREKAGVKLLKYEPKLETSATSRGVVMLEYNDLSFKATRSGYTMRQAMNEAGYSNIVWGEAPVLGYYEADELLENQLEFSEYKNFLLKGDYQHIGIAEVEGEINGCPTQIIVQQFAGYIPPNYDKSDIESWDQALASLKEVLPSWKKIKNAPNLYKNHQDEANRIIEIMHLRISRIEGIVSKMKANKWLTNEEIAFTKQDQELYKEQDKLAEFLNSKEW